MYPGVMGVPIRRDFLVRATDFESVSNSLPALGAGRLPRVRRVVACLCCPIAARLHRLSGTSDMTSCIALLRGINVGRAKRIAMAELRALIEELGFSEVRTLLNSGNAVFHALRPNVDKIAAAMETAIASRFGFTVSVVVLTGKHLSVIIAENRLPEAGVDPSRMVVAFVNNRQVLSKLQPLLAQDWAPDAIRLGSSAAYLWCADGINNSALVKAFSRVTGEAATSRNWATVIKLQALASA